MLLVPFSNDWADSGSKLDLKGVYQSTRPGDGRICNNLPIRRHNDWERKGLKYVTLATLEDVALVVPYLKSRGISAVEVQKSYLMDGLGSFNIAMYLTEQPNREAAEEAALEARLAQLQAKRPAVAKFDIADSEPLETPIQSGVVTDSGYVPEPKKRGRPRKVQPETATTLV